MCLCNVDKVCSVCHGRLSVYKFMMTEWEKTNPRPKSINIEEHYNWSIARGRALKEYQIRTGIFKV